MKCDNIMKNIPVSRFRFNPCLVLVEEAVTAFMGIDKKKLLRAEKKEREGAFLSA